MIDQIYKEAKERMHKSVEAVARELTTVRTGKASPHLLDMVRVEAYGSTMPLNQVATINTPEPRLITVQPFDKSTISDIVKGIQKADLGLNPSVDANLIRIVVPQLNEERRKELVRHCKQLAEEGKVAVRNIRREFNDKIKALKKDSKLSEDQEADGHDRIQKITDEQVKKIDDLFSKKEVEVMEV